MTAIAAAAVRPSIRPLTARSLPGAGAKLRFAVHGPAVEIDASVPALADPVQDLLGPFSVGGFPQGFVPVHGTVRPYNQAEVLRHLSPAARPMPVADDLAELFEEGERFWIVDERWGMAEVNFLKGQWRSWVLPRPQFDAVRCAEMAVVWPLAQLLRPRGLYLVPAAAVAREGWAALIVCPFGVEPELDALARSGYRLVSQRWTALREEDGRLALLHMPGPIQRSPRPHLRYGADETPRGDDRGTAADAAHDLRRAWGDGGWVDLLARHPQARQNHAFCDAVLVADPGRRARASLKELEPSAAAALLRQAWPIVELHPSRRHSPLPSRLAQRCRCAELQLSRSPAELLPLLDRLRRLAA